MSQGEYLQLEYEWRHQDVFSGFIDFQAQCEGRVFVFKDDFVQIGGLILRVDGLNGILSSQLKTKQYN